MFTLAGAAVKYASDGRNKAEDEMTRQEDLIAKSNAEIIKKETAREKAGRLEGIENWLTYLNEEWGIEFRYPDGISLR
jgi:hypothetical protein